MKYPNFPDISWKPQKPWAWSPQSTVELGWITALAMEAATAIAVAIILLPFLPHFATFAPPGTMSL